MHVGSAASVPLAGPIISVAGRTGSVVLANTDISGFGTASVLDVGTAADEIVQLNGSAQLPAVDGSQLTALSIGPHINSAITKAIPVDADHLGLMDSAAANVLKKLSWANVKATLALLFARLAGAPGGQALNGGTGSGEGLSLSSTSHPTKGAITLGTASEYDQANDRLGIGTLTPSAKVHVVSTGEQLRLEYDSSNLSAFTVNSSGQLKIASPVTFRPPSAISASANGDLTFEATSDTALTIKYRGSDGTERSAVITLS